MKAPINIKGSVFREDNPFAMVVLSVLGAACEVEEGTVRAVALPLRLIIKDAGGSLDMLGGPGVVRSLVSTGHVERHISDFDIIAYSLSRKGLVVLLKRDRDESISFVREWYYILATVLTFEPYSNVSTGFEVGRIVESFCRNVQDSLCLDAKIFSLMRFLRSGGFRSKEKRKK